MTIRQSINSWIREMKQIVGAENFVWITGKKDQIQELQEKACLSSELIKLNQEKLPGCFLRRTDVNDVARVEDRTFICCEKKQDAGPTNNWENPEIMLSKLFDIAKNSYKGKTMYAIPYCMGPVDSEYSKIGIELTDSIYVVLNMCIMTRVGLNLLDRVEKYEDIVRGLHCSCNLDPEKKYITHFPEKNLIISVNSAYGGNVLLGKKCFALRIASYLGKNEGWMAEHMLILGIKRPKEDTKYVCAAFPSACGKTNLAMMIPPEIYKEKGYEVFCVGDDIAWLHKASDGRLWAINPENGFFGVAPGTNEKSNPNALKLTQSDTIFTNVAYNQDDGTVWWEGLSKNPPKNLIDWTGNPCKENSNKPAAHPNSRFTSPAKNCPCLSEKFENKFGVPISAIIFGGRRAEITPLVYQSFNWNHGVFIGSTMASETTAAASGKVGVVRRDPMAMLPFCGYNMSSYFLHWIKMGKELGEKAPKIFNVNWFRLGKDGNFVWPGFGENLRIIDWILDRCENKLNAQETAIGYTPYPEDINIDNLELDEQTINDILTIDKNLWLKESEDISKFYEKFGAALPEELSNELEQLIMRLKK